MPLLQLSDREVVRIAGEDARKLLNDTLTCRFDEGLVGAGRWFALLSPQGKVQVEGLVTEAEGAYWFDMDGGLVSEFIKRMKLYRLRAKAEIEHLPSRAVLWCDGDMPAIEGAIAYRDGRAEGLGRRAIVPREDADRLAPATGEALAYQMARVAAGVAEYGADFGANEVFPHDIGMDFLGGVDFKKGCYIGQEVVSRMQHRGTARRRPVLVAGVPEGAAAGAPVMIREREAGTIGGEVDGHAVAIVRLDRVTGDLATVGGLPVELSLPRWAPYQFGPSPSAEPAVRLDPTVEDDM